MTLTRMFVGGDWRAALDGAEDRAFSPATGEDLGPVARGDRADAQQAIAAAQKAYPGWAAETAFARAAALHRVADTCERRREELARALSSIRASRCTPRPTTRSTSSSRCGAARPRTACAWRA